MNTTAQFSPRNRSIFLFVLLCILLPLSPIVQSGSSVPVEPGLPNGTAVTEAAPFSLSGTDTVHILLIGRDSGDPDVPSRADTVLLCTLQKGNDKLILTSFLRDLYVDIPGHGKNRLNAAYALGGAELLKQTLCDNFGIRPQGTLEVDFSGFQDIVDTLGGVTISLRQDEAEAINKSTSGKLTAGSQLLTGREALAFVRIRKLDDDGDFSRTARQQKLLEAIVHSFRGSGPGKLLSLARTMIPLAQTDLSARTLLRLITEALPLLPRLTVTGQQIPQTGAYTYETVDGMSVLVPDPERIRKHLKQTLPGL